MLSLSESSHFRLVFAVVVLSVILKDFTVGPNDHLEVVRFDVEVVKQNPYLFGHCFEVLFLVLFAVEVVLELMEFAPEFFDFEANEGIDELVFFFQELLVEGDCFGFELPEMLLADLHFPAHPHILDFVDDHCNFWKFLTVTA